MASEKIPKIGFISLGCPKAGSDTEKIMTRARSQGYDISDSYTDSDVVVVNTCGFIDSAVEESLNTIEEAIKNNGNVIVTGCLGEKKEIIKAKAYWGSSWDFNKILLCSSTALAGVLSYCIFKK